MILFISQFSRYLVKLWNFEIFTFHSLSSPSHLIKVFLLTLMWWHVIPKIQFKRHLLNLCCNFSNINTNFHTNCTKDCTLKGTLTHGFALKVQFKIILKQSTELRTSSNLFSKNLKLWQIWSLTFKWNFTLGFTCFIDDTINRVISGGMWITHCK